MPTVPFYGRQVDLAAHRAEKAARLARGKRAEWPVTRAQYWHFCELLEQIRTVQEGTDRYQAIIDEMKSIPGYPRDIDQERDLIYFRITDSHPITQRRAS